MNKFSMSCAIGALLCISSAAFAQDNPPSSATGLQAGDNAQTTNQQAGSTAMHKKTMKHKKMSSGTGSGTGTPGAGGAATPGGPGAPVSASGSGS